MIISNIEQAKQILKEIQTMLFDSSIEKIELFPKTLNIEKLLNDTIIDFNNSKKKKK